MTRASASPRSRSSTATWMMLLAGPMVWYFYFWIVYLLAEGACQLDGLKFGLLGLPAVSTVTLAFTLGASTLVTIAARRSYQEWKDGSPAIDDDRGLALAGLLLSGIFLVSILATGLPALAMEPC